jgi:3-(3-hydroxy-phenyl)propionate hydroxylase
MSETRRDHDVAIVGYGPVGALTALLLAEAGLRVAVLERSVEPVVLPRAVGLDGESVRAFQRIGRGDAVAAILQPYREGEQVCFTDSKHQPYFGMPLAEDGPNGWRDIAFFDQPELEALLREMTGAHPGIDVFLGSEVTALEQGPDDVVLRVDAPAGTGPAAVRASWVVGCDGASSFVRRAAGIEWISLGYDQDWLVVDITQGPGADLPIDTMQVCAPERLTTYVCVKDPNRRWEFQLVGEETREEMLRPEKIRELLQPWIAPEHYEIRRAAVYQFHAATAGGWRQGRVFLAGDAAHQTPPFLGQGLNAGFRDAVNLGWKLPLVHEGRCDAAMLDTYAAERDPHARDLVEWAVAVGQLMETFAAREAGLPDPHASVDQSSGYGQGRTAPPLRAGALVTEQVAACRPVGALFSQPFVKAAGSAAERLDERMGPGFAVVARTDADLRIGAEARSVLERLGGRTLSFDGLEIVQGARDRCLDDHAAAIVRPDRYVFGVVDADWDLDRLLLELGRKLGLR